MDPADECLVDLDESVKGLTVGGDHCRADLVKDLKRRLIPLDAELPLELDRQDPWSQRGGEEGGVEPRRERELRSVHHRARCQADVLPAGLADDGLPGGVGVVSRPITRWAGETPRPTQVEQIPQARILVREHLLELADRCRGRKWHSCHTLHVGGCCVNRISRIP